MFRHRGFPVSRRHQTPGPSSFGPGCEDLAANVLMVVIAIVALFVLLQPGR